nr:metalloproteinase inhibitor 1-like [Lytechinus pictus]
MAFVEVILTALMLVLMTTSSSSSSICSSCPAKHLQQQFCDAEIVLRGRVKDDMTVKVVSFFKSPSSFNAMKRRGITVTFDRPSCRESHLKPGATYLIMGSSHGNVLHIGSCDAAILWSNLKSVQRQGVESVYGLFCDECRVNETHSVIRPHIDPFLEENEIQSGADTLWRKEDCFYNPLASRQYMVDDCETMYSVCVPNMDGTGRCSWLQSEKYIYCSKRRKNSACLQMGGAYAFLPGWTCPENCDDIQEDCLREMCLQATAGIKCPTSIHQRPIPYILDNNV